MLIDLEVCNTNEGGSDATGAKLRIRGKGSGHAECGGKEAAIPLIAVTTRKADREQFTSAMAMALATHKEVELRFKIFCTLAGQNHDGTCIGQLCVCVCAHVRGCVCVFVRVCAHARACKHSRASTRCAVLCLDGANTQWTTIGRERVFAKFAHACVRFG